jgi:hypothetical protein
MIDFVEACFKVRNERAAQKVIQAREGTLASEPWWEGTGTASERVGTMLRKLAPLYVQAKMLARKPLAPAKGAKAERKGKPVQVYLGKGIPAKGFDDVFHAEYWAWKKVADEGHREACIVAEDGRVIPVDPDRAVRMTYGRREAGASMKVSKGGGSGPWMKASQDRCSFSKG